MKTRLKLLLPHFSQRTTSTLIIFISIVMIPLSIYGQGSGNNGGPWGPPENTDDMQQYLIRLFDWNYEMGPNEHEFYCEGRMPDMEKMCANFSKSSFYYNQNPNCRGLVGDVNKVLMDENTGMDSLRMAMCMRDSEHLNPVAWIRGVMMMLIGGKPEMRGMWTPPMLEIMPSMFINDEAMSEAKHQSTYVVPRRTCVHVNGLVGEDNGIENLLWYWREDVMLNSFHWYWHLTYPFMGTDPRGDRRGELFYYTHHSLVARYHAERLSVGLSSVLPLELYPGTRILEPYNSHLTDINSGANWTPRMPNVLLRDVANVPLNGEPQMVDIIERLRRLRRIEQAIKAGRAITSHGQKVPLRNFDGIDIIGDIIEASIWTINQDLYGYPGVHNEGHVLIGLVEDPQNDFGLPPGVMADPGTAMRDPIFYRYHTTVDAYFTKYKDTLPPYMPSAGDLPLIFEGVKIMSLALRPIAGRRVNKLKTFFSQKMYDLSRGLDFNRSEVAGPITTCVKHLDHQKFNYEIVIKRDIHTTSRATIRIFLAPRYNEHGHRYSMEEQRLLFFQLDRFPVYLVPGLNKIIRKSTESTLTIPFPQSYAELQQDLSNRTPYCGCGWPQHLLMPRGTINGLDFDLFVMITNGDEDAVPIPHGAGSDSGGGATQCRPAPIFCGIVGENYPDAKPMGYPFDRRPYSIVGNNGPWYAGPWSASSHRIVSTIEEYVAGIPNTATVPIRIYHKGLDHVKIYPIHKRKDPIQCSPYHYNFMCYIYSMFNKR